MTSHRIGQPDCFDLELVRVLPLGRIAISHFVPPYSRSYQLLAVREIEARSDKLDLSDAALTAAILKAIPTANAYQGGDGTDTIVLTAANAVALSADSTFAGKIDGFEKLSITNATAIGTVNLANLDNINYVVSANSAASSAAVTENGLVTFQTLTAGQSVTVAGRTVTVSAGASATATEIAAAFLSGNPTTVGTNGTLTVSGALTGWTAAANSTGQLKFTSTTAATDVANLITTYSDAALAAATAVGAGTKTDGSAGAAESTAWTMSGLTNGQSYTISGLTVTANKTLTATEVAAAFVAGTTSAGNFTVSGAYVAPTGWTLGTFGTIAGVLTLTNGVNGDVGDFIAAPTANGAGASPTDAAVSEYVQGAAAGVTTSVGLTIDNMASGGTLELTATGAGVIVNVKDAATGTADVLNVVANAADAANLGTLKAADVETINISVANKTTSFSTVYKDGVAVKVADAASSNTIALDANAAKAVTVAGAGKLTLDLAAANKVATVDASANTGGLSLDLSAHNGVAVTVTGGAGNDVLKASVGLNAKADVLVGGAGSDTLYVGTNGAKLTGGEGNDLFVVAANAGNLHEIETRGHDLAAHQQACSIKSFKDAVYKARKLGGHGKLRFTLNEPLASLRPLMETLCDQNLRKFGDQHACRHLPKWSAYLPELAIALSVSGLSQLSTLRLDGEVVASVLSFVHKQRRSLYLIDYDPKFVRYSPSKILLKKLIEQTFADGGVFCFGAGSSAYKRDWGPAVGELKAVLVFFNPAARAALEGQLGLRWLNSLGGV